MTENTTPHNTILGDDDDDLFAAVSKVQKEEQYMADTEQVRKDLENATTMLSYIFDKGLDIDRKHIERIVESKEKIANKQWTKTAEIDFYMTYKELTKIIRPVTVDSLASSRPTSLEAVGKIGKFFGRKSRRALSRRSTLGYTLSTVGCMALLLVIQIYFFLGSTRLDSIIESNDEFSEVSKRMSELSVIIAAAPDNLSYSNEWDACNSRIGELDDQIQSNVDLLGPWVQGLRSLSFNTTVNTDTIKTKDPDFHKANTAIIQEAKSYRRILGIYVLPLLYGIIGGFTFVLRELTSEIKELTFSTGSNIKYILRILLGAIAGLAIGLFWGDIQNAKQFGLSSLSPMLLAFLVGYCVEYLLQFLERICNSFFNKNAEYFEKKPIEDLAKKKPEKGNDEPAKAETAKGEAAVEAASATA